MTPGLGRALFPLLRSLAVALAIAPSSAALPAPSVDACNDRQELKLSSEEFNALRDQLVQFGCLPAGSRPRSMRELAPALLRFQAALGLTQTGRYDCDTFYELISPDLFTARPCD